MTNKNIENKNTAFLLSNQVKQILNSKGFTALFNMRDYTFFKKQCGKAFDKSQAIAQKFIEEANPQQNDFNEYTF